MPLPNGAQLQPPEIVHAMGFTQDKTPAVSTLHEVFSHLDVAAFEQALQAWYQERVGHRVGNIVLDGKGLQGIHGEELPGVRLVAMYMDEAGLVLVQAGAATVAMRESCQQHRVSLLAFPCTAAW